MNTSTSWHVIFDWDRRRDSHFGPKCELVARVALRETLGGFQGSSAGAFTYASGRSVRLRHGPCCTRRVGHATRGTTIELFRAGTFDVKVLLYSTGTQERQSIGVERAVEISSSLTTRPTKIRGRDRGEHSYELLCAFRGFGETCLVIINPCFCWGSPPQRSSKTLVTQRSGRARAFEIVADSLAVLYSIGTWV